MTCKTLCARRRQREPVVCYHDDPDYGFAGAGEIDRYRHAAEQLSRCVAIWRNIIKRKAAPGGGAAELIRSARRLFRRQRDVDRRRCLVNEAGAEAPACHRRVLRCLDGESQCTAAPCLYNEITTTIQLESSPMRL